MGTYYFNITAKKNTKNTGLVWVFIFICFGLHSCNAIFEKDISDDAPVMILPGNQDTINSNKVHFKWMEMEGASFYNLQLVKPSFANIDAFVLDSNINAQEFYQILSPGDYQFKLRGENGGHVSNYVGPYSIYVDSVSDLSEQFVSLISPANEIYISGLDDLILVWQNLYAADNYEFLLKVGDDFESGSALTVDLNINTLSYLLSSDFFSAEGSYFWGIRGVNITSATNYSNRKINVDQTNPNSPELISPIDEFIHPIEDPITLKWTTGTDPGSINSPVLSTVEISTSNSFIDFEEFSGITSDSLVYTFPSVGIFWWRVKADDEVGNPSEFYSEEWQITVE